MKKRKVLIFVSTILVALSLIFTSAAVFALNNDKTDKPILTKEILQEISAKRMNNAWQDMKQSFNIDETAYLKVGLQDLNKLYQGELDIKFDANESAEYSDIIRSLLHTLKDGNLKPYILIKRDKSEVIFLTKDKDGNNIMRKSTKSEGKWNKEEKITKGQPIYTVDLSQYQ